MNTVYTVYTPSKGTHQMSNPQTPDCSDCRGYGEVAVPGTYGPTISPEMLETRTCGTCHGEGTVAA